MISEVNELGYQSEALEDSRLCVGYWSLQTQYFTLPQHLSHSNSFLGLYFFKLQRYHMLYFLSNTAADQVFTKMIDSSLDWSGSEISPSTSELIQLLSDTIFG